jgi:hypothetical protein
MTVEQASKNENRSRISRLLSFLLACSTVIAAVAAAKSACLNRLRFYAPTRFSFGSGARLSE